MREVFIPDIKNPQMVHDENGRLRRVMPGEVLPTKDQALEAEAHEDQDSKWQKLEEQREALVEHFDEIQRLIGKGPA